MPDQTSPRRRARLPFGPPPAYVPSKGESVPGRGGGGDDTSRPLRNPSPLPDPEYNINLPQQGIRSYLARSPYPATPGDIIQYMRPGYPPPVIPTFLIFGRGELTERERERERERRRRASHTPETKTGTEKA